MMRAASWLGSWPYRAGVRIRNRQFDHGGRQIHRAGVPVISVGNLTTGGTGKTPIVCSLAKRIRAMDRRVSLVSRGYGRGESGQNDEAAELFARLRDVPHVQDPDRVEAARIAVEELETEVVLMDDGFQHRRLHRDLDIVVIDATCPFGFGHLLPRGLLREPVRAIRRADLIIVSRCGLVDDVALETIIAKLRRVDPRIGDEVPLITSDHRPASLLRHPEDSMSLSLLNNAPVAMVCAIGNPEAFRRTIESCGGTVVGSRKLPDHDRFEPATVRELQSWIEGLARPVDYVVCTHKDLVKLQTDRLGGIPLVALLIDWTVIRGEDELHAAIEKVVG